ncbi:MAG: DNA repair protein RecN [Anaerolineales bacterium]|nr:DNA repair protein RecN [Anaerolineales bacterium]
MLASLSITDFAIIDQLTLEFSAGFVVLTGETGAGKSIIIDAVGLLLGGKADPTLVRAGAEVARVEGVFQLTDAARDAVAAILEREALVGDEAPDAAAGELTLTRDLRREGRSACRVNGQLVSLAILREIGQQVVDVHGQSEHLSLLRVREHLYLLDRFADLEAERETVGQAARELGALRQELAQLRRDERERERRLDMLDFQINEITTARLKPGEDQALLQERTRLANAEKLAALADEAGLALAGGGDDEAVSAADLLSRAVKALGQLAKIDPALESHRATAHGLAEQFKDLAHEVQDYRDAIEFNPKRLDAVEERLELIKRLQRKYGETLEAVLAFAAKAQADRAALVNASERIAELEKHEQALLRRVGQLGARLTAARRAAGERLGRGIEAELTDLRMERARFAVDAQWQDDPAGAFVDSRRVAFDATGLDRVEFLVAPNVGEGLKPLVKIASGGETARLMLALKGVLARADRTPTLIFDEIDQGLGGRVGTVVGRKLWALARNHQVLCITHLPQLAGFGDQHFKVEKVIAGDRTLTHVRPLTKADRVAELAQMLGGAGEKTLATAEELLLLVREEKAALGAGR